MTLLQHATELAEKGLHVFPLIPDSKLPAIKDFPRAATCEPSQLEKWWKQNPDFNIGISTSRFNGSEALLAVDVDNKGSKRGNETLLDLECEGKNFPETFEQKTPTGGRHLIYRVKESVRQGRDVLGPGLDIRSKGGYLVGAGSHLAGGFYESEARDLVIAPPWLVETCGKAQHKLTTPDRVPGIESSRASDRATRYLLEEAPLALEGSGGDQTTYQVACRVMDFGVDPLTALELMAEHWNPRCVPPWVFEELALKVDHAKLYRISPIGSGSVEAAFAGIPTEDETSLSPIQRLNKEYAYIGGSSGYVIRETVDENGQFKIDHIDAQVFHRNLASKFLSFSGKTVPLTEVWMESPERREYDGMVFAPGRKPPSLFYNLWRGFSVTPISAPEKLTQFFEHSRMNVCAGDASLHEWLMQYFAHMVQRPWEKPQVALVMRGQKGVGKNVLVETVGSLFGGHFAVTAKRDQVLGRFNSMIENKIFLVLDEAFWSGDRSIEGQLKDLVTGHAHTIERKGFEPYRVTNCLRVAILGNEKWVVPASWDERRFAVFDVGKGRIQDHDFFGSLLEGMDRGGREALLHYFLTKDISKFQLGMAPATIGLLKQKIQSLKVVQKWWYECLLSGAIEENGEDTPWPSSAAKHRVRSSFERHVKATNVRAVVPSVEEFSVELLECCPSLTLGRNRIDKSLQYTFKFPSLQQARKEWDTFIGFNSTWDESESEDEVLK